MSHRTVLLISVALLGLPGCEDRTANEPVRTPDAGSDQSEPLRFVSDDFSRVYQIFLRRNITNQLKAEYWARYYKDRWVRWTGQLVAVSPSGLKFRQLRNTVTFDVSVVINEPHRSRIRRLLTVGKFYTYIARFGQYDDVFRTLYMDQGVVVNPGPDGVHGELAPPPPPLQQGPVSEPQKP